jgi:hypothetical protein
VKALLLTAALLLVPAATIAQAPKGWPTAVCHTEDEIAGQAAAAGLAEYRRAEHVVDDLGSFDLVIAYLAKNGNGFGVWFNKGCAVDVQDAVRDGADRYFDAYFGQRS